MTLKKARLAALALLVSAFTALGLTAAPAAAAPVIPQPQAILDVPGPYNTGPRAGVRLTVHEGDLIVRTPGTIISGRDIRGCVVVEARNVTIRDSIVRGHRNRACVGALVRVQGNDYSLLIEHTEIVPRFQSHVVNGIMGWNITARQLEIRNVIDQAHFHGAGNVRLERSWLHSNLHYTNDPGWGGGPSHDDNVQIQSGSGYWILGNLLEGSHNAAIMITQDAGVSQNMMIRDNIIRDGGCQVNLAQKTRPPFVNIDLVANEFGPGSAFNCNVLRPPGGDINHGSTNYRTDGLPLVVIERQQ